MLLTETIHYQSQGEFQGTTLTMKKQNLDNQYILTGGKNPHY